MAIDTSPRPALAVESEHPVEHVDVLIIGGTWDLFRYPGIRSDSDMHTLGYRFRPWTEAEAIADGPSILRYVHDTAREAGIDRHVRLGHCVLRAAWSSAEAR